MKIQENAVAEIPIELIGDILLRLPVEDLIRFRCVSKQWRSLIDSPNFVESHLKLPNKPRSVLVIHEKERIYYFHLDSASNADSLAILKELAEPCYQIYGDNDGIVGQVNGLVCCLCSRDHGVLIWNPWTMKHIQIAPPPERRKMRWPGKCTTFWSWGFGYNKDSDDYIVITLASLVTVSGALDRTFVWLYSLRSGSWRNIDDCPYTMSGFQQDVVFLDGSFYWVVDSPSDRCYPGLICALNLGNLEYSLLPLPNLGVTIYVRHLGVLDGCLFVTCNDHRIRDVDLVVMKEYGVKESWTWLMRYPRSYIPLAYIRNGSELLFVTSSEVMSYEFATGSIKRVIPGLASFFDSVVCSPSLVWPRSDPGTRSDLLPGSSARG